MNSKLLSAIEQLHDMAKVESLWEGKEITFKFIPHEHPSVKAYVEESLKPMIPLPLTVESGLDTEMYIRETIDIGYYWDIEVSDEV